MRVALLVGVQDLVVAEVADLRAIKRDQIRSFNGVEKNAIDIVCTIFYRFVHPLNKRTQLFSTLSYHQ